MQGQVGSYKVTAKAEGSGFGKSFFHMVNINILGLYSDLNRKPGDYRAVATSLEGHAVVGMHAKMHSLLLANCN